MFVLHRIASGKRLASNWNGITRRIACISRLHPKADGHKICWNLCGWKNKNITYWRCRSRFCRPTDSLTWLSISGRESLPTFFWWCSRFRTTKTRLILFPLMWLAEADDTFCFSSKFYSCRFNMNLICLLECSIFYAVNYVERTKKTVNCWSDLNFPNDLYTGRS